MRGEGFAEGLEVLRLERTGVFRDLIKIGIGAPLADLVTDDGGSAITLLVEGDVVGGGRGWKRVYAGAETLAPGMDARFGNVVIVVHGNGGPAGGGGEEAARVADLMMGNPFREVGGVVGAAGF